VLIDQRKDTPLWGWSDPATVLTIPIIYPLLSDMLYVCLWRNRDANVDALIDKTGNTNYAKWYDLVNEYLDQRDEFLTKSNAQFYALSYEQVITDKEQVAGLAYTLGIRDRATVTKAQGVL